jgi:hypothetical protein
MVVGADFGIRQMSINDNSSHTLRLPEFLGVGPSRTGTTWLHEALIPVAGLPRLKETHFFSTRYRRGVKWYAAQFRDCSKDVPIGEICPYFGTPEALARVQQQIPRCRIICTFRDPVERAYSYYKLARSYGWTRSGFEETLEELPNIMECNRYAHYLGQWRLRFGNEGVLVMLYDDLIADRQAFVDQICDFIGAQRLSLSNRSFDERAENSFASAPTNPYLARMASLTAAVLAAMRADRPVKSLSRTALWKFCFGRGAPFPPLAAEVETRVRMRLLPEIEALEEIIQRDLSAWKTSRPSL